MKKYYDAPEFELLRFSFESLMDGESHLVHSKQQGYGEDGGGEGDGEFGN